MTYRSGPPRPVSSFLPLDPAARAAAVLAEARAGAPDLPAPYVPSTPPPAREPGCDDDEPAPNSPADAGYLSREQLSDAAAARAAPVHVPKVCSSCPAPILWAQVLELDEAGRWSRVKNPETGRMKSMPVDFQPNPLGNVILFHREGEGIVCRVLKKNETPPPGARLRTSHFATCPNAKQHRRKRR
jgi:hypothetical protein